MPWRSEEEMFRRLTYRRWSRAVMYLLLAVAGFIFCLSPSELVTLNLSFFVVMVWSTGWTVAALICMVGAATDFWIGEYTGIPLLSSTLALYGFSIVIASGLSIDPVFAIGVIFLGISSGLFARWRDVQFIKRTADRAAKESRANGG